MFINNRLGFVEGTETMMAQENRMTQIANNLANVDTNGYKKEDVTFWEMLFTATDNRQRVGKAVRVITDHSQGSLAATGNKLDFSISGEGYFKILTPDGFAYTRNGNFTLNSTGQLTTMDGDLVMGQGGAIILKNDQIQVGRDGLITADGKSINQLSLVSFSGQDDLVKRGHNLFVTKGNAGGGRVVESPSIQQGFLEKSNVNMVAEMTEMIDLQRAYQTQQKIIQTIDDLNGQAISKVGKLT